LESRSAATDSEAGPTRAEWAASAHAICGRLLKRLNALPQPQGFQQLANQLGFAMRTFRTVVAQIEALPPPPDDALLVKQMLAAFRANAITLQRARAAALRQDAQGVEAAVGEGEKPALRAGQLAFDLGLTKCSQPENP
jgi:hypothetical protein